MRTKYRCCLASRSGNPDNPWASAINQQLKKQALVCYVLRKPVREVRLRLQLPMHFQIYPVKRCEQRP